VWFLAHPVAGDERFTYAQNMAHIEWVARECFRAGLLVIAPYVLTCRILDDALPADRALGMSVNDGVIRGLGRLLMCGHKRSSGMQHELELVTTLLTHHVWDFVGIADAELPGELGR
jgi:hypothetical protein